MFDNSILNIRFGTGDIRAGAGAVSRCGSGSRLGRLIKTSLMCFFYLKLLAKAGRHAGERGGG
jgi:hypothetical protein